MSCEYKTLLSYSFLSLPIYSYQYIHVVFLSIRRVSLQKSHISLFVS